MCVCACCTKWIVSLFVFILSGEETLRGEKNGESCKSKQIMQRSCIAVVCSFLFFHVHQLEWTCVGCTPRWLGVAEEDVGATCGAAMTETGETVLVSTAEWTALVVPDGVT